MSTAYTRADITTFLRRLVDADPAVRAHAAGWLGVLGDRGATFSIAACLREETHEDVCLAMIHALEQLRDPQALDVLIELLNDSRSLIAEHARAAIRSLSPEGLVYARALLNSAEATERLLAARLIEQIAAAGIPVHTETLRECCLSHALSDEEQAVRIALTGILGLFANEHALPALLQMLKGEHESKVLAAAARALGSFTNMEATLALAEALHHHAIMVQEQAALALARIATPSAICVLADGLQEGVPTLRHCIAAALGTIVDPHAIRAVTIALSDRDPEVRMDAARAISRQQQASGSQICDDLLTDALPPLFFLLHEEIPEVRVAAAESLQAFADPRCIEPLLAALNDADARVRAAAAGALQYRGDTRPLFPLRFALRDPHVEVRRAVMAALASYPCHRCLEPCALSALQDTDTEVRRLAARRLRDCRSSKVISHLLAALPGSDAETRWVMLQTLQRLGADAQHIRPQLTALLATDASHLRVAAVRLLIELSLPPDPDEFIALLQDPSVAIRLFVARALEGRVEAQHVPQLKHYLQEEYDAGVRQAMQCILHRLPTPAVTPVDTI